MHTYTYMYTHAYTYTQTHIHTHKACLPPGIDLLHLSCLILSSLHWVRHQHLLGTEPGVVAQKQLPYGIGLSGLMPNQEGAKDEEPWEITPPAGSAEPPE